MYRGPRLNQRSQTLKSDEAKWSNLTRITLVGSFLGGNTHEFEKMRRGDGLVCLYSSYGYVFMWSCGRTEKSPNGQKHHIYSLPAAVEVSGKWGVYGLWGWRFFFLGGVGEGAYKKVQDYQAQYICQTSVIFKVLLGVFLLGFLLVF